MKNTCRMVVAVVSIALFSLAAHSQIRQTHLYIDDGHGSFTVLSAPLGGGVITFPSSGTLLTSTGGGTITLGQNTGSGPSTGTIGSLVFDDGRSSSSYTATLYPATAMGTNQIFTFPDTGGTLVTALTAIRNDSNVQVHADFNISDSKWDDLSSGAVGMITNTGDHTTNSSYALILSDGVSSNFGTHVGLEFAENHGATTYDIKGSNSTWSVTSGGTVNGASYQVADTTVVSVNASEQNLFLGGQSGISNADGFQNTACGYTSLQSNTSGSGNTASGYGALNLNSSGWDNTAFGLQALQHNTSGSNNTAAGFGSLSVNTGHDNTGLGYRVLVSNISGDDNTAIGSDADVGSDGLHDATAIGANAVVATSYTIQLGDVGVTLVNAMGSLNIGGNYQIADTTVVLVNASEQNLFLGGQVGTANIGGFQNIGCGYKSLQSNTYGNDNTAAGYEALNMNVDGGDNSAFGQQALSRNISGNFNTACGDAALNSSTGADNTGCGFSALGSNTSGHDNTAIGWEADVGSNNLHDATAIGAGASVTTSNTIQLGDVGVGLVNTSGAFATAKALGATTTPTSGGYYQDNAIIAWGEVPASGTSFTSQFGHAAIDAAHSTTGQYVITLPTTPANVSVTVTLEDFGFAKATYNSGTGAITINIENTSLAAADIAFYYQVTARP